ncbi:hypothetical protein Tco_0974359 [Tanacetum coccineum]|uniref:Uncharacterized protein n=1 Tax=Tanacetum coccineum TaxID=301880 RepID=A0ABQ5EBF1_9ASTR
MKKLVTPVVEAVATKEKALVTPVVEAVATKGKAGCSKAANMTKEAVAYIKSAKSGRSGSSAVGGGSCSGDDNGHIGHYTLHLGKKVYETMYLCVVLWINIGITRKEKEYLKQNYKNLYDSIKKTRVQTKDHNESLIAQMNKKSMKNADLKAHIQEKVLAIVALKNELRKLKGNSMDTKFAKPSVLGKPVLQSLRNQSVVRQPTAFKSKRSKISKPRFAYQVDVKNNLLKPVTQHYLPKGRESAFAKPDHVIASSESRNNSKNMPRFSSNDIVHNHYLD